MKLHLLFDIFGLIIADEAFPARMMLRKWSDIEDVVVQYDEYLFMFLCVVVDFGLWFEFYVNACWLHSIKYIEILMSDQFNMSSEDYSPIIEG